MSAIQPRSTPFARVRQTQRNWRQVAGCNGGRGESQDGHGHRDYPERRTDKSVQRPDAKACEIAQKRPKALLAALFFSLPLFRVDRRRTPVE